jgi:hypothetical protein
MFLYAFDLIELNGDDLSLNRIPGRALATIDASVALRTWRGSRRKPVVIARDGFPIDDAGARAQPSQGLHDQREAIG